MTKNLICEISQDTGVLDYPQEKRKIVQRPSLWKINLETNERTFRYEFPLSSVPGDGSLMLSVTIDDDDCDEIFAYIPDPSESCLIVVDTKNSKSWRFDHNYFRPNPFEGDFDLDGIKYQSRFGIKSIALSNRKLDGSRIAFFHPLAAYSEFQVSTKVLKNESLASRVWHDRDFKLIGTDLNSNRGMHVFDPLSEVIFSAELKKNAISCWNSKGKELMKLSELHLIAQNNETLIFPVDVKVRVL